jgi:hypothetical protein
MNPEQEQAEAIWQHTLSQIRIARTTRRRRRITVVATSLCLLGAGWISLQTRPDHQAPQVAETPIPAPEPKLAVMRLDENGDTILEELAPSELGSIELAFGLTPMVSDDLRDW